jgi:hypothetical protein
MASALASLLSLSFDAVTCFSAAYLASVEMGSNVTMLCALSTCEENFGVVTYSTGLADYGP